MMGPIGFNTAAFGALENDLSFPKPHLLQHFLGGIAFGHCPLKQLLNPHSSDGSHNTLTGSVNIVFRCEANAKNAHVWNTIVLITQ